MTIFITLIQICSHQKKKHNLTDGNKKRIGKIDEYFDIYSFNAMTYGFLNKIAGFKIIDNIIEGNNTILKNKEITEMYYNLLLFKNKYNDDFIIDHIKQKKITSSELNPKSWTVYN